MSYIGLFSHYQFDNRVYQPSYVSSNTPRFFNGMRIQIFPSDKLKPPVSANVRSLIGFGRVCGPYDFFTEHLRHFYGRSATLGIRPAYPVRSWTSRNGYSGQGETMRIPINTTSSRQMAYRCADFGHEVGRRLVKAFNNLNPIFSAVIAEQATARESQSREAQRYESVYEARKRELLISLRQKVSEMRAKRQSD